jgi:hypothetical protein
MSSQRWTNQETLFPSHVSPEVDQPKNIVLAHDVPKVDQPGNIVS